MNPFAFDFMLRAFVAVALVGAVAPLVGTFVVQRRQSLIGDGMGHMAFAGVGFAFLVGLNPIVGALLLTGLASLALYRLQRDGLAGDVSLALIFYGGIATGFLFAASSQRLNPVIGLLFGSPLNLTWADVAVIGVLALAVVLVVVGLYGPLVSLAFDEQAARVAGVPVSGLALTLTLVVSMVVVGGMNAIGLLLVSAMMVIPVAAASQVASSYRMTMIVGSAIGAGSAVAGLLIAFYADLAPGAAIVVTAIGCYLVVRFLRPGFAARALRRADPA